MTNVCAVSVRLYSRNLKKGVLSWDRNESNGSTISLDRYVFEAFGNFLTRRTYPNALILIL